MQLEAVDQGDLAVLNFYSRHYKAPSHLVPKSLSGHYYKLVDGDHILAVTRHIFLTPFLLQTCSTVVHSDIRGQGIGTVLNDLVEKDAQDRGIQKITCNIYVDNIPSIVLKLKRGYLIEGLLRDHDDKGKHEYILGKAI
jgi:ribosomal protein S18 acetylase RimI-like enzyme